MSTPVRTVLSRLTDLDPSRDEELASPDEAEATLRWVLAQGRTEPRAEARHGRRKILVGTAAAVALAVVVSVTLPSLLGERATPPAAAIPMLDYSRPDGADPTTELQQLAQELRASATAADDTGRYFFEHRRYVGYSMHEVEVSEGHWEVDRLVPSEDESYFWLDTTDLSGGRLYLDDGQAGDAGEHVHEPGTLVPFLDTWADAAGHADAYESARSIYDAVTLNDPQRRFPGHYLIDAYNAEANRLPVEERATFLEAIAMADDVISYGQVEDREGRTGVAFGASRSEDDEGETVEVELILIIDPATGMVLETDTVFPNDLPGAPDVVETYELVVDSRFTDTLPLCGDVTCPGAGPATG